MKKKLTLIVVMLLTGYAFAFAQAGRVSGIVKEDQGAPLPGVTVRVKGTNNAVTTDANGKYSISVPGTGTLEFSSIGYISQDQPIGD
jgi:hypothetical protein